MGYLWAVLNSPERNRLRDFPHEVGMEGGVPLGGHLNRCVPQDFGEGENIPAGHHEVGGVGCPQVVKANRGHSRPFYRPGEVIPGEVVGLGGQVRTF